MCIVSQCAVCRCIALYTAVIALKLSTDFLSMMQNLNTKDLSHLELIVDSILVAVGSPSKGIIVKIFGKPTQLRSFDREGPELY